MQSPATLFRFVTRWVSQPRASCRRRGVTILEILIAAALTLLLMVAIVQAFTVISGSVTNGRAMLEMSGQIRIATHRLREDLDGVTATLTPPLRPSAGLGYFEYIEGSGNDITVTPPPPNVEYTTIGDTDDVLMFTARSKGEPFIGRFDADSNPATPSAVIQSQVAEIIWWVRFDPRDDRNGDGIWNPGEQLMLHRRVLLVRPDMNNNNGRVSNGNNPAALVAWYAENDVSVHFQPDPANPGMYLGLSANSLADLTKRENRFAHNPGVFPHSVDPATLNGLVLSGNSDGEDVMLSNVVAFDVKAYDPAAPVFADSTGNYALVPGDNEYDTNKPSFISMGIPVPIGRGAFVDLNYWNSATSYFSGLPNPKSQLGTVPTYDTWSLHYESDGIDQDGVGGADQGSNGFDDDNANGVDDLGERETLPPYPRPLRGIKITIRMVEPDTQQVRQLSVVSDFVPE